MSGGIESERHVLCECEEYGMDRNIWKGNWEREMGNVDKRNGMKGYEATNVRMDEETIQFLGKVWNKRLRNERTRLNEEVR